MEHDFDSECVEFVEIKIHGMMILPKEVKCVNRNIGPSYWMIEMVNGEIIICTDLVFKFRLKE